MMQNNEDYIASNFYDERLTTIRGVKFTHREIDVIASIFHMRGASKIASLLSISTRTVETHTANIMRKMDANSREGILDFVEIGGHSPGIKKHYCNLVTQANFKKLLRATYKQLHSKALTCFIINDNNPKELEPFVTSFKEHLGLCSIKTSLIESNAQADIANSLRQAPVQEKTHIVYLISSGLIDELNTSEYKNIAQFLKIKATSVTFLGHFSTMSTISNEIVEIGFIDIGGSNDYYSTFCGVIKRIYPDPHLDLLICEFMKNRKLMIDSLEDVTTNNIEHSQEEQVQNNVGFNFNRSQKSLAILTVLILLGTCIYFIIRDDLTSQLSVKHKVRSIRSDLIVPTGSTFLNRPYIIEKIEATFSNRNAIQAVALVGIGGAGKTTVARQYALQQDSSVVWEINAITRQSLRDSFERLGYALCKSEQEHKLYRGFQEIKNKIEKDEKILFFVKEKLKQQSNWLLIFDNVERISNVQKYFPCDPTVWGKGKIIITTSDSNTKNNNLINKSIEIGELTCEEKLGLFIKIMNNESSIQFTPDQRNEIKVFLNDIPPFPLDVSIAAYYIKSTNTPYAKYLECLKENNFDFEAIQADVVKEASDYSKTRYQIVTLSLKELIDTHKDFGELLLLISLLDSQNISRTLLSYHKGDVVAANFIYNLKKYSLITNVSTSNTIPMLSLHRTIQGISLGYLTRALALSHNSPHLLSIGNSLENYIVDALDREDFSRMKHLASHCEAFLSHDTLINDALKSSIGGALGCVYYYLRHNHKAKQQLEENLSLVKRYYGENHIKYARLLLYLGSLYRSLGDYKNAKDLLDQSLKIYKANTNDRRSAKALGCLGAVYRDLGDYKKAKEFLEQSLQMHEKYSPNHIGHAWILAYLGNTYLTLGDYQKAKNLLTQSLTIYKQQDEDYIGVSWVLGYLGNAHKLLGNLEEARKLIEKSLLIIRKYFSDEHVFIATGLSYLASIYIEMGDYHQAKSLLQKSLAIYERNYGKCHIEIARVQRTLGEAYAGEGDIEKAEDLINKSLLALQQKNYPESYKSYESLAELYVRKAEQAKSEGDTKQASILTRQATNYLEKALEILKSNFPEDSQHIVRIKSKINGS